MGIIFFNLKLKQASPKENGCPFESDQNNKIKWTECKKLFVFFQLDSEVLKNLKNDFKCIQDDSEFFKKLLNFSLSAKIEDLNDASNTSAFNLHSVLVPNYMRINEFKIPYKFYLKCEPVHIIEYIPLITIVTMLSILFMLIVFIVYMYWKTYSILCKHKQIHLKQENILKSKILFLVSRYSERTITFYISINVSDQTDLIQIVDSFILNLKVIFR